VSVAKSPEQVALDVAADAAYRAYWEAQQRFTPAERGADVLQGADGTPSKHIDVFVEDAILEAVEPTGVNILSEERGWIDQGSAFTLVVDPVDGTANAAAGVPLSCFSAAIAEDHTFTHAMTSWLHTNDRWAASMHESEYRVSATASVEDAAVSLLRPHASNVEAWNRVAARAKRVRILGCSTLDGVLVATGASDAFVDAASDTHRIMDIAAAAVLVPASGGVIRDVHDRPIEFDTDLTRRWSGVVASSEALVEELIELVLGK
jgi:myo-inositol-1(or 4)-monophosphatase